MKSIEQIYEEKLQELINLGEVEVKNSIVSIVKSDDKGNATSSDKEEEEDTEDEKEEDSESDKEEEEEEDTEDEKEEEEDKGKQEEQEEQPPQKTKIPSLKQMKNAILTLLQYDDKTEDELIADTKEYFEELIHV